MKRTIDTIKHRNSHEKEQRKKTLWFVAVVEDFFGPFSSPFVARDALNRFQFQFPGPLYGPARGYMNVYGVDSEEDLFEDHSSTIAHLWPAEMLAYWHHKFEPNIPYYFSLLPREVKYMLCEFLDRENDLESEVCRSYVEKGKEVVAEKRQALAEAERRLEIQRNTQDKWYLHLSQEAPRVFSFLDGPNFNPDLATTVVENIKK